MTLSVVVWKWGNKYTAEHVNRLRGMVRRHLRVPHKFYCITDDPTGLDEFVDVVNIWNDYADMRLHYRRLKILSEEMRQYFGDRILQIDIDMLITQDITDLVDIKDEIKVWKCPSKSPNRIAYNPSFLLMNTGVLDNVWKEFQHDTANLIAKANAEKWYGTDQAILSYYCDKLKVPTWTMEDGFYSFRDHIIHKSTRMPENARVVGFYDAFDQAEYTEKFKWVKAHWRCLRLDILDELIKKHKWKKGAEIGVFKGELHFHLTSRNPQLTLYGVDSWDTTHPYYGPKYPLAEYKAKVFDEAKHHPNSIIINTTSEKAAKTIEDKSLDFVFIDADHSKEAVLQDIDLWLPKLRVGGWLLGHDCHMEGVRAALKQKGFIKKPTYKEWPDYVWSIENTRQ